MDNKKYIPLLRFNGFHKDWTVKKLGEVIETKPFKPYLASPQIEGKYEIIQQGDNPIYGYSNGTPFSDFNNVILFGDHTLSLYKPIAPFFVATDGIRIISGQTKIDSFYLFYLLEKYKPISEGYKRYYSILVDSNCSLPTLPEQELIGNYFKHLDELINSKEKKIAKLKSIKAACLDKMFPKEGEAVPQLRFKGFNEDWVVKKLGEVIEVNSGRDYKHLSEGSIPVYGTGGYMLSVNDALSYKENAIGIGRKGTIDKPYILYAPFWTVDTLFYTIPKNGYNLNFIFDIFQNIDWKKKDESTGVPSLSKNAIIQIDISLPTLPEQELIGNYFKHLDELIEKSERQLEKLKSIKQGCLDKMFIND